MVYRFNSNLRYRASAYISVLQSDNPELTVPGWCGPIRSYEKRNQDLWTPDLTPRVLRTEKVKEPSDFFGPGGDDVIVSERFKLLIESFERDQHSFFEISLRNEKNVRWPGRFFFWKIRSFIPCIEVEKSEIEWDRMAHDDGFKLIWTRGGNVACININQTRGHHIWLPHPTITSDVFCSNEFHAECVKQKIRYLIWDKCLESDSPWTPEGNEYPTEAQKRNASK